MMDGYLTHPHSTFPRWWPIDRHSIHRAFTPIDHGRTHPFTPIDAEPPQISEWPTLDHSEPDQVVVSVLERTCIAWRRGRERGGEDEGAWGMDHGAWRTAGSARYRNLGRHEWGG